MALRKAIRGDTVNGEVTSSGSDTESPLSSFAEASPQQYDLRYHGPGFGGGNVEGIHAPTLTDGGGGQYR